MREQVAERSHFFRQWIRAPLVTASIVPSSRMLATAMTRSLHPGAAPVIELGPGTGIITRHILARGVPENQLVLVECNPYFAMRLRARFPKARIIEDFAEHLAGTAFDSAPRAVISSLPLMSMPNDRVEAILAAVFSVLEPGGIMIQFTYAPRCPVNRDIRRRLGLASRLQEVVWRNVPPAGIHQVYRIAA